MRLSLDTKKEFYKNDFMRAQNKVSFKGLPESMMKIVCSAMDSNRLLTKTSQSFDTRATMRTIRKHIGKSADVLLEHIKGDDIINQALIIKGDKLQFNDKRPLRLIVDGLLYPISKIPFYLFYGGLNVLKKFNFVKNSNWLKNFEKSSFYKATHSYLKKDDKLNSLRGLMEIGSKGTVMGKAAREKAFIQNTAKTFDSKFGNYNGVHERALTRIVTGLIPAFFLANDAHNLSILCTNNKKEAAVEKDLRFKQEMKRVFSNAYIQLITLGALSKFINKSKAWFVGVTVGTILVTEIYSRLSTGKKIHFISPEEAKAINAKEKMKKAQDNMKKGLTFVVDEAPTALNVKLNGINKFIENPDGNKFKDIEARRNKKTQKADKNKGKSNALLSLSTVAKYFGIVLVAGFAMRYIKKFPPVSKLFNSIAKGYNKIYSRITTKANHISKTDMTKVMDKMKKCGFGTIAQAYEKTVMDYQKLLAMPQFIDKEFITAIRKTGNKTLAKNIEEFASGKNPTALINNLKNESIDHNFKRFMRYLRMSKQQDLINKINEINKDGKIDYIKLHKLFGKSENSKYTEIFENIFTADDNSLRLKLLEKAKYALKSAGKEKIWQNAENKALADIKTKDFFDLGKTKIPVVKEIVDFCVEPFKFIWNYGTLSYKGASKLIDLFNPKPNKGVKDLDTVAKALNSLTKKIKMTDKSFTDMFNEKIVKGFNSTTMSKIANSELSALAKSASTITTMSFLMSDNYNMVMLKSDGEDLEEAKLKRTERAVQEMSRFFWQQLFINLFNNTFAGPYNSSLLGASVVNTASTTIGEICTRKAVGLPLGASSKEEILELERNNLSGNGFKSKFFRFMSKLTGKKVLSEREMKTSKK